MADNRELTLSDSEILIYDILYGVEIEYKIKISKYITELYKYDRVIDKIKAIMKKGNVKILSDRIIREIDEITWIILIHRM